MGCSDIVKVLLCHLLRKFLFAYLKAFYAVPEMGWVVPRDRFEFHLHLLETEFPPLYSPLTAPSHESESTVLSHAAEQR